MASVPGQREEPPADGEAVAAFRQLLADRKATLETTTADTRTRPFGAEVTACNLGEILVLHVSGDLDVYGAPRLRQASIDAVADGHYQLVIDMAGVSYIDSTGLGVLVGALKRARAHDGWVALAGMSEPVARLFRVTGLAKVFADGETIENAAAAAREKH